MPDAERREEVFLIEQVDPFAYSDERRQQLENDANDLIVDENVNPLDNVAENLVDGRNEEPTNAIGTMPNAPANDDAADANDLIVVENVDPLGDVVENVVDGRNEEPTNAIDPLTKDAADNVENPVENCGIIKVELLQIQTDNMDELQQLLDEVATAQSNNEPLNRSTAQEYDEEDDEESDIVWVELPDQIYPEPIHCPDYGLTKREDDRFSGDIPYRELVSNY